MVTPGWFLRMCLDSRVGEKGWQRDERKQGRMKKKNCKEERLSRGGVGGGVGEMFEAPFSPSLPTLLLGDIWRKCK